MTSFRHRLGRALAVTTAAAAIGTVGLTGTAWADLAPSCVTVSSSSAGSGYTRWTIKNTCKSGQYVKVIISFNPDIGCTYYNSGQSRSYVYSWPSKVDRLEKC
jgi:hypothetical protein